MPKLCLPNNSVSNATADYMFMIMKSHYGVFVCVCVRACMFISVIANAVHIKLLQCVASHSL